MVINSEFRVSSAPPSAWVRRFAPLIRGGGRVLDLAARTGRHTRLLLETGFAVCVVDRDISALSPLAGIGCEVRQVDLETGAPWVLGTGYDGIVVTNYLHRPLLPAIAEALAAGGVLICETFAAATSGSGARTIPIFCSDPANCSTPLQC